MSPSSKRQRQFNKCDQCRKDRKACDPIRRDWHSKRQRCERCERADLPCGPSKRVLKRALQSSYQAREMEDQAKGAIFDLEDTPEVATSGSDEVKIVRTSGNLVSMDEAKYTVVFLRILFYMHLSCKIHLGSNVPESTVNDVLGQIFDIARYVAARLDNSDARVHDHSTTQERSARAVSLWLKYIADNLVLRIATVGEVAESSDMSSTTEWLLEAQTWVRFDSLSSESTKILSLVANFPTSAHQEMSDRHRWVDRTSDVNDCCTTYENLAKGLDEYLDRLKLTWDPKQGQSSTAPQILQSATFMPPACIAYLNGDPQAGLKLWISSETKPDVSGPYDLLNRNLVALVTQHCDVTFMKRLCEYRPGSFPMTKRDRLGLNPLALALAQESPTIASFFLDTTGPNRVSVPQRQLEYWLDQCVIAGKPKIADRLLDEHFCATRQPRAKLYYLDRYLVTDRRKAAEWLIDKIPAAPAESPKRKELTDRLEAKWPDLAKRLRDKQIELPQSHLVIARCEEIVQRHLRRS